MNFGKKKVFTTLYCLSTVKAYSQLLLCEAHKLIIASVRLRRGLLITRCLTRGHGIESLGNNLRDQPPY